MISIRIGRCFPGISVTARVDTGYRRTWRDLFRPAPVTVCRVAGSRLSHWPLFVCSSHRVILVAALMTTYMQAVNISIPNAALPHIQGTLSMGDDEAGWVFSSYIAASAAVAPMSNWLAGRYGRKTIYQVSLAVFALGLILNTLATTSDQFVLARIVQGEPPVAPARPAFAGDPARGNAAGAACAHEPGVDRLLPARYQQRPRHRRLAQ